MMPQEPVIPNPVEPPDVRPETEVINDPDIPPGTPVDDVSEPLSEAPVVTD